MSAVVALAAAALALPVFFGSALTAMDAAAMGVLAWVLLGRAVGMTWSDVWRMGASITSVKSTRLDNLILRLCAFRNIRTIFYQIKEA